MSDVFNVTGAYDKPSYTEFDTITVKISGGDVQTTTVQGTAGPLVVPIVAADGAKTTINVPAVPVSITTVLPESVVIDKSAGPITDAAGRVYTVSADGLSLTAPAKV
jgi:hypothetical protein